MSEIQHPDEPQPVTLVRDGVEITTSVPREIVQLEASGFAIREDAPAPDDADVPAAAPAAEPAPASSDSQPAAVAAPAPSGRRAPKPAAAQEGDAK